MLAKVRSALFKGQDALFIVADLQDQRAILCRCASGDHAAAKAVALLGQSLQREANYQIFSQSSPSIVPRETPTRYSLVERTGEGTVISARRVRSLIL